MVGYGTRTPGPAWTTLEDRSSRSSSSVAPAEDTDMHDELSDSSHHMQDAPLPPPTKPPVYIERTRSRPQVAKKRTQGKKPSIPHIEPSGPKAGPSRPPITRPSANTTTPFEQAQSRKRALSASSSSDVDEVPPAQSGLIADRANRQKALSPTQPSSMQKEKVVETIVIDSDSSEANVVPVRRKKKKRKIRRSEPSLHGLAKVSGPSVGTAAAATGNSLSPTRRKLAIITPVIELTSSGDNRRKSLPNPIRSPRKSLSFRPSAEVISLTDSDEPVQAPRSSPKTPFKSPPKSLQRSLKYNTQGAILIDSSDNDSEDQVSNLLSPPEKLLQDTGEHMDDLDIAAPPPEVTAFGSEPSMSTFAKELPMTEAAELAELRSPSSRERVPSSSVIEDQMQELDLGALSNDHIDKPVVLHITKLPDDESIDTNISPDHRNDVPAPTAEKSVQESREDVDLAYSVDSQLQIDVGAESDQWVTPEAQNMPIPELGQSTVPAETSPSRASLPLSSGFPHELLNEATASATHRALSTPSRSPFIRDVVQHKTPSLTSLYSGQNGFFKALYQKHHPSAETSSQRIRKSSVSSTSGSVVKRSEVQKTTSSLIATPASPSRSSSLQSRNLRTLSPATLPPNEPPALELLPSFSPCGLPSASGVYDAPSSVPARSSPELLHLDSGRIISPSAADNGGAPSSGLVDSGELHSSGSSEAITSTALVSTDISAEQPIESPTIQVQATPFADTTQPSDPPEVALPSTSTMTATESDPKEPIVNPHEVKEVAQLAVTTESSQNGSARKPRVPTHRATAQEPTTMSLTDLLNQVYRDKRKPQSSKPPSSKPPPQLPRQASIGKPKVNDTSHTHIPSVADDKTGDRIPGVTTSQIIDLTMSDEEKSLSLPAAEEHPVATQDIESEVPLPRRSTRRSTTHTSESSAGPSEISDEFSHSLVVPRVASPDALPEDADEPSALDMMAVKHGFRVLTKTKHRRMWLAKEFANFYAVAKEIPYDLQDRINALPLWARRADNMQVKLFEACITENTSEDEPHAPPIRIINEVDDDLTPPYEFYYSNLMWHGVGVPKPDRANLQGCDCDGPCDPNSKTCLCVKRQHKYWHDHGFLYDKRGRLRTHDYPIFECNDFCECSESCMNRVVQHGRKYTIVIKKTIGKGWGIFAGNQKIPANTYIGTYAGEYLTDEEAERRGSIYNKFGRTYLFDVDFYYLKKGDQEWDNKYSVDAYHTGNFTRYLNHSCDPNCQINPCYINEANLEKPLLTVFTRRDVLPHEELCFSYFGDADEEDEEDNNKKEHSRNQNDAVYAPCQCGTVKCRGKMWK